MDIVKSNSSTREHYKGKHRFEHWYRDNQVYFITARCRGRFAAFAEDEAKAIFWEKFDKYTREFGFTSWVTSLLDNHYDSLGYLLRGASLPVMMQRTHGSVAKLVNDTLETRLIPFWVDSGKQSYFDGLIDTEFLQSLHIKYSGVEFSINAFIAMDTLPLTKHLSTHEFHHSNARIVRDLNRSFSVGVCR